MNKKTQTVIICAAIIFTGFFVWFALTSSNTISNNSSKDNKGLTQNTQNTSSPEKPLEGATIIDNNKINNSAPVSNGNDTKKEASSSEKSLGETTSKDTQNETTKNNEKEGNKSSNSDQYENYITYEVKEGESLTTICKQFAQSSPINILSKVILDTNKLTNSSEIKAGMKLRIPSKYTNGSKYTVASGDSLFTIASTYMDDTKIFDAIERIKKDNFLTSDSIRIGDELFLAGVSKTKESSSTPASSNISLNTKEEDSTKKYISYTVKKDETLTSIAKQYEKYCPVSTASKTILKVNNISSPSEIKEGTVLKIPEIYLTTGEKYKIQYGDSLSKIAINHMRNLEMYKAIDKIMKDNFKTTQNITIGEEIFIASSDL